MRERVLRFHQKRLFAAPTPVVFIKIGFLAIPDPSDGIKTVVFAVPDPSDGFFLVILNLFQDLSAEKEAGARSEMLKQVQHDITMSRVSFKRHPDHTSF
ncbi:MAG: hypothetical protein J6L60_00420 [Bacteroidaceae bacterium]|nr:hypothetical protein [Bacteroidaceae bacterium]